MPQRLAGADQRGGTLELLDGEQPQRVAHEYGDPGLRVVPARRWLTPPHRQRERGEAEIGLGLAATGREPQQVRERARPVAPLGVRRHGERRQVEQHEGELERPPATVSRFIYARRRLVERDRLVPAPDVGRHGVDALQMHSPVGEGERLARDRVPLEQLDAALDAARRTAGIVQHLRGLPGVVGQIPVGVVLAGLLPVDPIPVAGHERRQPGDELIGCGFGEGRKSFHVEDHVGQFWEVVVGLRVRHAGEGHFVRGNGDRADLDRPHRIGGGPRHVHARAVADRELRMEPVGHREPALLRPVGRITSAHHARPGQEYRCAVRRRDGQGTSSTVSSLTAPYPRRPADAPCVGELGVCGRAGNGRLGQELLVSAVAKPSAAQASKTFPSPLATTRSSSSSCSADAQCTAS